MESSNKVSTTAVLVAAVALIAIIIGAVVGLFALDNGKGNATPLITSLLGFLGTVATGVFAVLRIENVKNDVGEVKNLVNGNMDKTFTHAREIAVETATQAVAQTVDKFTNPRRDPNARTRETDFDSEPQAEAG